jgi:VIT1/CCC1 family predicted Fe2+/Mn2+ transporter
VLNPLESWNEEQRCAFLYRACADAEASAPRAELFRRLSGEAEARAVIWRAQLTAQGHPAPGRYQPDLRTRLVAHLVRRFGPRRFESVLVAMKVRGMGVYTGSTTIDAGSSSTPTSAGILQRHRGLYGGGTLRAAVFGVNDGLLANACLILGVAGINTDTRVIALTGLAGLCAGALAMAAGEYASVCAQREGSEPRGNPEREDPKQFPAARAQELALTYSAKGLTKGAASRLAARNIADPEHGRNALSREKRGLVAEELTTPWRAALSSFLAFAVGAFIPLVPFLLLSGSVAFPVSIAMTALGLVAVGALLSLFTGRSAFRSAARMLVLGALAGAITYSVGQLASVALG